MALPTKNLGPFDPNVVTGFVRAFIGPTRTGNVTLDTPYGATGIPEYATWLYVGGTGNINYVKWDGTTQILMAVPVGWHRIPSTMVLTTSTTATNMVWGN